MSKLSLGRMSFIRNIFRRDNQRAELGISSRDLLRNAQFGNMGGALDILNTDLDGMLTLDKGMLSRQLDYARMDEYAEISSALDIYSDDATQKDSTTGKVLWVESDDKSVKDELTDLFDNRVDIENNIWEITRNLCIAEGTMVWGPSGKEIQDLAIGDRVIDALGKETIVRKVMDNGTREVVRVKTKHRELLLTPDHRLYVEDKNGIRSWMAVEDFFVKRRSPSSGRTIGNPHENNTKVVICTRSLPGKPLKISDIGYQDILEHSNKGNPNDLVLPEYITPDLCRLIGFLIGDGFRAHSDTAHSFMYARGINKEQNDKYDRLLEDIGLKVSVIKEDQYSVVHSIRFECLMQALGWIDGAQNRRVPSWVYSLPEDHRREFIFGFIDADGWEIRRKSCGVKAWEFEIANEKLTYDLKALIDGLGYRSGNVRSRKREPGFKIKNKIVKTTSDSFSMSFSEYDFGDQFVAEKVLSVEPVGQRRVFDIEVECEHHSFISAGICSHNCKTGNDYEELIIGGDNAGVVGINFLPTQSMRRIENSKGDLLGFIQTFSDNLDFTPEQFKKFQLKGGSGVNDTKDIAAFEDWRVSHMRLVSKYRESMYGWSVIDSARWIWKRLMLLEDAVLVYKLTRSPSRYAFYIDTGKAPRREAERIVQEAMHRLKKKKFVNPKCLTGETCVKMLDGTDKSMAELSRDYKDREFWVYSYDLENGKVVPGLARNPRKTDEQQAIYRVVLDNGAVVRCNYIHPFLLRNGEYKPACELKAGDSLMSHRVHASAVKAGSASIESRIDKAAPLLEKMLDIIESHVVRDPLVTSAELSDRLNSDECFLEIYEALPTTVKGTMTGGVLKAFLKKQGYSDFKAYKIEKAGQARWRNRTYGNEPTSAMNNHKVVSVTLLDGYEDVYNIDVDTYHNFLLTAGVFTHNTGKLDLRVNPMSMDQDFFLAMRDGRETTRVESLSGPSYQQVDDVQYFLYKLYAALKVPRAYMGYDENMPSRATLSQEDVRFARTVLRIQREVVNGMRRIAKVNLAAKRMDPAAVKFDLRMTVPSSIFELGQMEALRTRAELASSMEGHVSHHWLLKNIYRLSDEEIESIMMQKKKDSGGEDGTTGGMGVESISGGRIVRPQLGRLMRPMTERELFAGSPEDEKRIEKIVRRELERPDSYIGRSMRETGNLLRELAATIRTTSRAA